MRKRLRPRIRPTKLIKLRNLECFKEVEARVKAGWALPRVADFIQRERGEYIDVSRDGLVKQLATYRDTLASGELLRTRMPDRMEELVERAEEAVDEVEELAKLYKLQMDRVNIDVTSEKQIKKLFKQTGQEIFYAMKILMASATIKQDYGLIDRAPQELNVNANVLSLDFVAKYGSEEVEKVVTDPASRRKVLNFVEHLAKRETLQRSKLLEDGLDLEGPVVDLGKK